MIAVRNDHMQIAPGRSTRCRRPARRVVTDVEYQGTYVLLGLESIAGATTPAPVSVLLGEAAFLARPYATGEHVRLDWHAADARVLAPDVARTHCGVGARTPTAELEPSPQRSVAPAT